MSTSNELKCVPLKTLNVCNGGFLLSTYTFTANGTEITRPFDGLPHSQTSPVGGATEKQLAKAMEDAYQTHALLITEHGMAVNELLFKLAEKPGELLKVEYLTAWRPATKKWQKKFDTKEHPAMLWMIRRGQKTEEAPDEDEECD